MAIHPVDTAIVAIYMIGTVLFGLWLGRGQRDLTAYMLGGRDLPWWAVLGSIVATETSTVTFLSVPGLAFAADGDLRFLQLSLGYIAGRVAVSFFLLPLYFRGKLLTAYEVLHDRFGGATKQSASLLFLITRNLGDGLRLFLTAIVLEQVLGISLPLCIVIIGFVTIVYTFFGGMKAVVWNDCIQLAVYVGGGIIALCLIVQSLPDGWSGFQEYAVNQDKFRLFDFSFDFTVTLTFWAGLIGGAFLSLGTHGTDQMMVQRYLCARTQKDARLALIGSGFAVLVQFLLFLMVGVALACYYNAVEPRAFSSNDEVFATYIVTKMPVGMMGLLLAAVFSAAMSTLSSSLNSSASSAVNDLWAPLRKVDMQSNEAIAAGRCFTVFFGIIQIVVGIAASYISKSVVNGALGIAGFSAGILLGIFALGVLAKSVKQPGALAGLFGGLVVLTCVKFLTPIAWPWYAVIGSVSTFMIGVGFSMVIGESESLETRNTKESLESK